MMYAIRNKRTGGYIGAANGFNGRGGTHQEADKLLEDARGFHELRTAKGFLTVWLKGVHSRSFHTDYESGHKEEGDIDIHPVPERKKEEMEIVEIEITAGRVVG